MSNLSYCRFQNTLGDLQDCNEHLFDEVASDIEKKSREILIKLCHEIAESVPLDEIKDLPFEEEEDEDE